MMRDEIKEPGCLRRRQVGAGDPDLFLVTGIAGDLAAPLELAVTAGDDVHHLLHGVHAAAGAEAGALPDLLGLVGSGGVDLAGPASDSLVSQLGVESAVVRRGLEEDELPLLDLLLVELLGGPPAPGHAVAAGLDGVGDLVLLLLLGSLQLQLQNTVAVVHLGGVLVLLLEVVADLFEVSELSPAGLSGTTAAHSVTLAESPHGLPHSDPAGVHVLQEQGHVTLRDVFQEDGRVLAGIVDEQVSEVGTAGGQQHPVGLEGFALGGQRHVGQLTLLPELERNICHWMKNGG